MEQGQLEEISNMDFLLSQKVGRRRTEMVKEMGWVERTVRAQMEKDKIGRERNFIFKLVREYYKQWRVKKAQTLKTI